MKASTLFITVAIFLVACSNQDSKKDQRGTTQATATSTAEILGTGATFPYPLYSKMFDEYNKQTGVKVSYQSIGSGGGIKQLMSKTVDFSASDVFLNNEQLKESTEPIVH